MSTKNEKPLWSVHVKDTRVGLQNQDLEPPRSRDKDPGVRALTSGHLCQPLSVTYQGPGKHAQSGVFPSNA